MADADYYALVATLTREDGTGVLGLPMHKDALTQKLNDLGIAFAPLDPALRIIRLRDVIYYYNEDGSVIRVGYWGVGAETARGLRVGDPYERMVTLYGEPDAKIGDSDVARYEYYHGDWIFWVEVSEHGTGNLENKILLMGIENPGLFGTDGSSVG